MNVYYNEIDSKAAHWLRCLIKAGLIPAGDVDERSITELKPEDLRGYGQCHFFAGIGGWPYALQLAGWPNGDQVWTGSCPCQPFSCAGKHLAERDERHLWPAFRSLIAECRPATVFGEQVAGQAGRGWLAGGRADLETLGYAVGCADLPAACAGTQASLISDHASCLTCGKHWDCCECVIPGPFAGQETVVIGSPHRRQRLWWVGYSELQRRDSQITGDRCGQDSEGRPHGPLANRSGRAGELANAGSPECGRRRESERPAGSLLHTADGCQVGDVADVSSQGRQERQGGAARTERQAPERSGGAGFWSEFDIVWCDERDIGKGWVARRVEPGTFPLADGLPGRVAKLRGLGNAIVPQVAAEFIKAFREAR